MAGPYRVSFLFNGLNRGFSETWGYNSTALLTDADRTAIKKFAILRVYLCAAGWSVVAARIVDLANPRESELLTIGTPAKAAPNAEGPDVPSAAWLARCQTVSNAKRQMWLRGGDDEWIKYDTVAQTWVMSADLAQRFATFKGQLIPGAGQPTPPWSVGKILRLNQAGTDTVQGGALTISPLNFAQIAVTAAPWARTDSIIVSGFKKPWSFLNGNYTPAAWSAAGNVVQLNKAVNAGFLLAPGAGVRIRRRVVQFERLSTMDLIRVGGRRTGRAFFVPVGRRSQR